MTKFKKGQWVTVRTQLKFPRPGLDESAKLAQGKRVLIEQVTPCYYGKDTVYLTKDNRYSTNFRDEDFTSFSDYIKLL